MKPSDQQCHADPVATNQLVKSENPDAELIEIDHRVDHLFTKVHKIEDELKEVEEFFENNKQENGNKDMNGRESFMTISAKKNQTRAVAARRRQELKLRQDKGNGNHDTEARSEKQLAQEISHARSARQISSELRDIDRHLEELREMVLQKCRKFSVDEKRKLSAAFTKLSPEHLIKALEIVAQSNPNFSGATDEVDLDMDNLSEATLWKLKIYVKEALKMQGTPPPVHAVKDEEKNINNKSINNKRKKKISDILAQNKRTKVEVMDK